MSLLEVQNLCLDYRAGEEVEHLIKGVSLSIEPGRTYGLIGESGSGKSLTALSITRLLPKGIYVRSGDVLFREQSLFSIPESKMQTLRGNAIGFVFQEPMTSLNPVMTAGQQVLESLSCHSDQRGAQARDKVLHLLDEVGIAAPQRVFDSYPHELSGGMKQRIVIAMALVGQPQLLIADEPTTALDVTIQAQILDLLKDLQERLGMAILFISHDLAVANQVADTIGVMQQGQLIEELPSQEFFQSATHDYSQNLLATLPDMSKRGTSLLTGDPLPARNGSANAADEALVKVDQLKVYFPIKKGLLKRTVDHVKAVEDVSFSLKRGKTLALVGESGSGKTTVARALLRLVKPTDGTIQFISADQKDADYESSWNQFVRGTQIVFQDPFASLNPKIPVGEAIAEGLLIRAMVDSPQEADAEVARLLEIVGLSPDFMRRYPHQFSGGQRQRLCIARALAVKPDFIIWDEPTSALDISVQAQIIDLFQSLQAQYHLGYLLITHDMSLVSYMADEVAVIYQGRLVEQGDAKNVFENPQNPYTQDLLAAVPTIPGHH